MDEQTLADLITEIDKLNHQLYKNPEDADSYSSLADCYNRLRLYPAAVNSLQAALRWEPDNAHLYQQLIETIETAHFSKLRSARRKSAA